MADPLEEPALKTPPGVISRFPTTHSDEQVWFYVAVTFSAVVPGALLLLRLYTKLRVVRELDWTDYLITLSFLCELALIVCGRLSLGEGAGVHQWDLKMHNSISVNYYIIIGEILYGPTIFLVKAAVLLQYLRLFAPQKSVNPFMFYSARIIIIITGIYYTISTSLTLFGCSPREAIWNPLITNARCIDNNTSVLFTCLFNITSDIIILILPVRAVWKLRIPTRNKFRILLLFAVGLLACIANVMIIFYENRLSGRNADVSYNIAWMGLWVIAEVSFGITVTGTFLLPKFIEARGAKLRSVYFSLTRPLMSLTPKLSFGNLLQSRMGTEATQEVSLDTVTIIGNSENDLAFTNSDQDTESHPSYEDVHDPTNYTGVNATDTPIGTEADNKGQAYSSSKRC